MAYHRKKYTSRRDRIKKHGRNFRLVVIFGLIMIAVLVFRNRVSIYDYIRTLFLLNRMAGNRKRKTLWIVIGVLAALVVIYWTGPQPATPDFEKLHLNRFSTDLNALEDSLKAAEAALPVKPDNHARIVWDTPYVRTAFSMVYLHGNGASQEEGDPFHEALAARYGCNLFLARLHDHGLESEEPMKDISPEPWMQSALDAIMVGKQIGEKVILVSCSTGSTLGLYLQSRFPDLVYAHIMFSPNIDLFDPRSFLLSGPWGLQLGRLVVGGENYSWTAPDKAEKYWYTTYRVEALTQLKTMIDATMTADNFNAIDEPVFMAYYFKDEQLQDSVVSVKRMIEMFDQLGTPVPAKMKVALPDAGTHVIASDLFNDQIATVWPPLIEFCEQTLGLPVARETDWRFFLDFR